MEVPATAALSLLDPLCGATSDGRSHYRRHPAGRAAADILDWCGKYISRDGANRSRVARKIERDFDSWCGPALGLPAQYVLVVREPQGFAGSPRTDSAELVSWNVEQWNDSVTARYPSEANHSFALQFYSDAGAAVLTLRTFSKADDFDPERDFARAFQALHDSGTTDLVLDLRENGGGKDANGSLLYSHIAPDTFHYVVKRVLNKKRFAFLRHTDDWFINWASIFYHKHRLPDGRWALSEKLDGVQSPQSHGFRGKVWILLGRGTFSTASEFASVAHHYHRATLIGEETATAADGGGGGAASTLVLKNTGLRLDVPLVTYLLPGAVENASGVGEHPDIIIEPTIADLFANRDAVRDSTLVLIRHSRTPASR